METHPSHIKKIEGKKEIKMWLERWMQKQDIMLEDKITNKRSIQEEINAHSNKHVKKTMEGSGSKCCNNTKVHSWTRKVQLATFGGCTEGETKEEHLVWALHQELETEQYNEVLNEIKLERSSESLKPEKEFVFFEEESVSPSSSFEPPNRKSSEVGIAIKGIGDAELLVEESLVKYHLMSQVGNLPWARIGSLFQTPTVGLIQHSPNSSQGQTALILVKSTFGPTHNANKGKPMSGYNVIQLTAKANESLLSKYANWDEDEGTVRVDFRETVT